MGQRWQVTTPQLMVHTARTPGTRLVTASSTLNLASSTRNLASSTRSILRAPSTLKTSTERSTAPSTLKTRSTHSQRTRGKSPDVAELDGFVPRSSHLCLEFCLLKFLQAA